MQYIPIKGMQVVNRCSIFTSKGRDWLSPVWWSKTNFWEKYTAPTPRRTHHPFYHDHYIHVIMIVIIESAGCL
jgi:hypothetical protein